LEDAALPERREKLKQRQAQCKKRLEQMEANKATQVSETDADARLLKKQGQAVAGYNVQIAFVKPVNHANSACRRKRRIVNSIVGSMKW
jgi:hypothetical protein